MDEINEIHDLHSKEGLEAFIKKYSEVTMKMSLRLVKAMDDGNVDNDEVKHLKEMKKHLDFAKKTYKELYGGIKKVGKTNEVLSDKDIVNKIASMQQTLGEIVVKMKK